MNEGGQRVRATASALQVRPSRVPMKLRCHQRSPCQSDELFPLDALTGLARGVRLRVHIPAQIPVSPR